MATQFNSINVKTNVGGDGIKERVPVKTIALTNQNLATDLTGTAINGYTLVAGDRFILAGQTTGTQNGIYIVDTVSYRADDYEIGMDCYQAFVTVTSGTYANTTWQATSSGVVGTGTQGFVESEILSYTAGDLVYANSTNTRAKLSAPVSATSVMTMTTAGVPSWTQTLGVPNGGTGLATITAGNLLLGAGTSAVSLLAPTTYKTIVSNSTPAFALSNTVYANIIGDGTTGATISTFTATASAVNYLDLLNNITGAAPRLTATGSDTNVSLALQAKGTGTFDLLGTAAASSAIRLLQKNGANYVSFKAPDTVASSVTWVLPSADGTSGQVLSTNGAGTLSFSSAGTSVVNAILSSVPIIVNNRTRATAAYFSFITARYGVSASCTVYFENVHGTAFNLIITDITNAATLSTTTVSTSGFKTITFTAPATNARLTFDVVKNSAGTPSTMYGVQLSIN